MQRGFVQGATGPATGQPGKSWVTRGRKGHDEWVLPMLVARDHARGLKILSLARKSLNFVPK